MFIYLSFYIITLNIIYIYVNIYKNIIYQFFRMSAKVKKIVEENKTQKNPVLSLDDKGLCLLTDITNDFTKLNHITELVLAHNKLTKLTQGMI